MAINGHSTAFWGWGFEGAQPSTKHAPRSKPLPSSNPFLQHPVLLRADDNLRERLARAGRWPPQRIVHQGALDTAQIVHLSHVQEEAVSRLSSKEWLLAIRWWVACNGVLGRLQVQEAALGCPRVNLSQARALFMM